MRVNCIGLADEIERPMLVRYFPGAKLGWDRGGRLGMDIDVWLVMSSGVALSKRRWGGLGHATESWGVAQACSYRPESLWQG